MKDQRYIELMEQVLSAYSNEEIDRYYNDVKTGGLKEHGFPRLTANIGILIAHGKRCDLTKRFTEMMDLCCDEIPKLKNAANEFSIKEVIFSFLELEEKKTLPQAQIDKWKEKLKSVTVENCYRVYAAAPDSPVHNWAAFAMVSEWMRYYIGAAPEDTLFIENQAASQWQWVEENGMYRDPNEPMVYDLVTRGLFALLFHFGYRGRHFEKWDDALKRAGLLTLKMLSVTGEIPYGGRSNQFLHNEAHGALILEYEASRYAKLGDMEKASRFRGAARRSLDHLSAWLEERPITHIKNAFPRESKYGCEGYAYFDKYMITAASFLYVAYLFSDDTIPGREPDDLSGESWQSSDHFHKLFLRAGEYFAEYDYRADYHYDASGWGRLHRKGAPGALCLSTPGTHTPVYAVDAEDLVPFAIVPEIQTEGVWLSGAAPEAVHKIENHGAQGESAFAQISCIWPGGEKIESSSLLDKDGLQLTVSGKNNEKAGLMIPLFAFDGRESTRIICTETVLSVTWRRWVCRYELEKGSFSDTEKTGYNRNGHYRLFRAAGDGGVKLRVRIFPEE